MPYGQSQAVTEILSAAAGSIGFSGIAIGATSLAGDPITADSTVALGLLIAGIGTTALLAWRAAKLVSRIESLEREVERNREKIRRQFEAMDRMRQQGGKNGGHNHA